MEITKPEHALQAWENGHHQDAAFQALLIDRLLTHQWTARAVYNCIEEHYPALSRYPDTQSTRKQLMHFLRQAMDVVEKERIEERKRYQGLALSI